MQAVRFWGLGVESFAFRGAMGVHVLGFLVLGSRGLAGFLLRDLV